MSAFAACDRSESKSPSSNLPLAFPSQIPTPLQLRKNLGRTRAFRDRQPPIDLPGGVYVAFVVFVNLGELAGAVVGVDLGAVEIFFRGGDAERFREGVEAHVLAAPFALFLHGVVDRRVTKAGAAGLLSGISFAR